MLLFFTFVQKLFIVAKEKYSCTNINLIFIYFGTVIFTSDIKKQIIICGQLLLVSAHVYIALAFLL